MNTCIKHGFDKKVCNPYRSNASGTFPASSTEVKLVYPDQGWLVLTEIFSTAGEVLHFNTGQIVVYCVTHILLLPAADFKSVNKSVDSLF